MEPNQSAIENFVKVGYSSVTLVVTALLAAIIGGGAVFAFVTISNIKTLTPVVINPSVIPETASGTNTLPPGYDFFDRGRSTTVTYAEPDSTVFNEMNFPTWKAKVTDTFPETVEIKLPTSTVSASYQKEFNIVLNLVLDIESQLHDGVGKAMALVQSEAAAGRYLSMFEAMQVAKKENETARNLSKELTTRLDSFALVATEQSDLEIKRLSTEIIQGARIYAGLNVKLADQSDGTLTGSVPTQAQLNDIQVTATGIASIGLTLGNSLKEMSAYLKQKAS